MPLARFFKCFEPTIGLTMRSALVCLLVVLCFLSALASCQPSRADAVSQSPACDLACVAEAKDVSVLELDGERLRVWAAGVERVSLETQDASLAIDEFNRLDVYRSKRLGLRPTKALYVLCRSATPQRRLAQVLADGSARGFSAVALGGRRGGVENYAPLRLWSAADAKSDQDKGLAVKYQPGETNLACPKAAVSPCPVILIGLDEGNCDGLMKNVEDGTRVGRLFGIVR